MDGSHLLPKLLHTIEARQSALEAHNRDVSFYISRLTDRHMRVRIRRTDLGDVLFDRAAGWAVVIEPRHGAVDLPAKRGRRRMAPQH